MTEIKNYLWHRQLHIFEVPFYYIEYGIAQLGALQVWLNARRNPKKALADYKHGLSLGGSRPVGELYRAAGISFDFSEGIIKPLVEAVAEEWEKLDLMRKLTHEEIVSRQVKKSEIRKIAFVCGA